jgi:hypothetical protein
MEKYIEKHLLKSQCDAVEETGYTRRFTPDELNQRKEELADVSISISEIEAEKKLADADFKYRRKPHDERKTVLLEQLKNKSEFVRENCYKFIDHDERLALFYNSDGELVSSRPIMPQEMQKTIFGQMRTGTND